jgi:hypothetical protein
MSILDATFLRIEKRESPMHETALERPAPLKVVELVGASS